MRVEILVQKFRGILGEIPPFPSSTGKKTKTVTVLSILKADLLGHARFCLSSFLSPLVCVSFQKAQN